MFLHTRCLDPLETALHEFEESEQELPLTTIMKPTGQTQRLHMLTLTVASQVAWLARCRDLTPFLAAASTTGGAVEEWATGQESQHYLLSPYLAEQKPIEEGGDQCSVPYQESRG